MDPISPALADAYGLLQTDIYPQLDEAESLASQAADWSDEDIDTARKLIPDR